MDQRLARWYRCGEAPPVQCATDDTIDALRKPTFGTCPHPRTGLMAAFGEHRKQVPAQVPGAAGDENGVRWCGHLTSTRPFRRCRLHLGQRVQQLLLLGGRDAELVERRDQLIDRELPLLLGDARPACEVFMSRPMQTQRPPVAQQSWPTMRLWRKLPAQFPGSVGEDVKPAQGGEYNDSHELYSLKTK
jgi:hypothetical protein